MARKTKNTKMAKKKMIIKKSKNKLKTWIKK